MTHLDNPIVLHYNNKQWVHTTMENDRQCGMENNMELQTIKYNNQWCMTEMGHNSQWTMPNIGKLQTVVNSE